MPQEANHAGGPPALIIGDTTRDGMTTPQLNAAIALSVSMLALLLALSLLGAVALVPFTAGAVAYMATEKR